MNPSPIEDMDVRLSEPTRRPVTINEHALFLDSLLTEADHDEIDEFVGEFSPSQTKSGKEISRLLNLLDNLPTGKYSQ